MGGENRPEKRLKLDDLKNQQDEIKRLKEVVKEQEKMLASKNKKLLEMEASWNKMEREKFKVEAENIKVEDRWIKVEDEKKQFEVKLQKLIECPVCLTLPRNGPVPCCANGHLVCSPCLEKLRGEDRMDCPTCREPFGEGKSLLAFALAEQVQHACHHQGCTKTTSLQRIVQHEKECKWRLILCPGDGRSCTEMTPFCNVEAHAQKCEDCVWPPTESPEAGLILDKHLDRDQLDDDACWPTNIIRSGGKLFFCRVDYETDENFTVDMVMKGNQEDCEKFLIEASIVDPNSDQTAIKAIYPPRPMKGDNKPNFCLTVPQALMSRVLKYNDESDEYCIKIHVKIIKLN